MASTRDLAIASVSAAAGAVAAAGALRLLSYYRATLAKPQSPPLPGAEPVAVNGTTAERPPAQPPFDPAKREGYISWDDYFMAIAFLSAERSKDPNRQVGACLVSQEGIILGSTNAISIARDPVKYELTKHIRVDASYMRSQELATMDSPEVVLTISFLGQRNLQEEIHWRQFPYVVHAEVNAILNTNHASAAGQKLYVTMFPCNECAKIIIQSGVSEVIYFIEKRIVNSDHVYIASHKLLSMAGVKVRKHQPQMAQIPIKFQER